MSLTQPDSAMPIAHRTIQSDEDLQAVVSVARQAGRIAMDTEFVAERTYYPALGLVQLALPNDPICLLVDPLAFNLNPIVGELIEDESIEKILHDPVQDLALLARLSGRSVHNVFDTRRFAGFIGLRSTISLGELIATLVGEELEKDQRRTNWLARPLSPEQLTYAAKDVAYLHLIRDQMCDGAEKAGRAQWLSEEKGRYEDQRLYQTGDVEQLFRRFSGKGRLDGAGRDRLRRLLTFREEEAQRRNLPRSWVLPDELLRYLALDPPAAFRDIETARGFQPKHHARYQRQLFEIVKVSQGATKDPPFNDREPLPPTKRGGKAVEKQITALAEHITQRAEAAGIDPAMVASKAELKELLQQTPGSIATNFLRANDWRQELLGEIWKTAIDGGR